MYAFRLTKYHSDNIFSLFIVGAKTEIHISILNKKGIFNSTNKWG